MSVQVDHIVQHWKGGGDELENLRLAHRHCNMKRQGEDLSPAQIRRNENAERRWAEILGEDKAKAIGKALNRGDETSLLTALPTMLAGLKAKKKATSKNKIAKKAPKKRTR
jgi:hypothetical protein